MVRILTVLIRAYQKVSRYMLPKACRFFPSCSDYALEAILKYGAWKGAGMALKRIFRCSPFSQGGYDPVR